VRWDGCQPWLSPASCLLPARRAHVHGVAYGLQGELEKREDAVKNDYRYDVSGWLAAAMGLCSVVWAGRAPPQPSWWAPGTQLLSVAFSREGGAAAGRLRGWHCSCGPDPDVTSPLCALVLQVGVVTNCAADIDTYCAEAKTKLRGNATVLKCLVENSGSVGDGCQSEMSRAVRFALWDYKPGAALTVGTTL